jgi:hypothetical protein
MSWDLQNAAAELMGELDGEPGTRLVNTPQPFNAILKALKRAHEAGAGGLTSIIHAS